MMNLNALKIDPEFQGKIPPLNAEEEHILEQNMIQERRLLNPLIIWNGYILDGHSRYRILKHHPEIAFEVKEIQLPDRYAALAWICQNQLGRRNLDPERRKFLMGKAYENEKLSVGAPVGNQNKVNQCGQNVHIDLHKRTCERIAERNGVNSKFVQRAEKYAKVRNIIESVFLFKHSFIKATEFITGQEKHCSDKKFHYTVNCSRIFYCSVNSYHSDCEIHYQNYKFIVKMNQFQKFSEQHIYYTNQKQRVHKP